SVLRIGSPIELKNSIGGDFIEIEVKEDRDDLSKILLEIKHVKEVKKNNSTYIVRTELGEEVAPEIIEAIRVRGIRISKISLTKPTLDEVYLAYTGRKLRDAQASWEEVFSIRRTIRRARS
ncbi:MAG: DUF4162 domain-containing protein, partial [Nitrososphaeria archaeon]|nr:DUF4162 domain-containing protein [Nitrososphaeria archaeon]